MAIEISHSSLRIATRPLPAFFLACILTLALYCPAAAGTLAVFPLLDLSQDENGMNLPLTEYLRKKAVEKGFTVLPESEIMAFMVRHRIRSLGVLTRYQLTTLHQDLKPDYVLLGTVCQLGEKPTVKVSLSLQLTRATDGVVVWSLIKDLHEDDLISLLAISDPETLNDLYERYFSTLFDTIPSEIKQGGDTPPTVGILTIHFPKDHVKPGEKMEAEIRVYYGGKEATAPTFHLLIDNKEYPVDQDGGSRLLKGSWLAQDQDGAYQVDLVAVFPSGQRQVNRLFEYTVDGVAPQITVHFVGTAINDDLYFNRELPILPRLQVPEVISRWDIAVYDKDNEQLLLQEDVGQIPPRITWNGMISGIESAPDGRYLIKVQAWDRAENLASFEGFVNLMRGKPEIKLTVERKEEGDVHVLMDNEVQSPLAFWFVKVYEKNGGLLTMQVGETLPAAVDFKLQSPDSREPLELIFAGQDRYGNLIRKKFDDILNMEPEKAEKEIVPESQWLENF